MRLALGPSGNQLFTMPTRDGVQQLLDDGHSYESAGRELGIAPGQAFLIATGEPPEDDGEQHLVNPPAFNPLRDETVLAWIRERAARGLRRSP